MTNKKFDRAAHCRRIASKGGRTTVERHGRAHMSKIGRKGFEVTTNRHFNGQRSWHTSWLSTAGARAYFESTSLRMKYTAGGDELWPKPVHPAHDDGLAF